MITRLFAFLGGGRIRGYLLLGILILSAIRTLTPQETFGPEGFTPESLALLRQIGLSDVYHSFWFYGILGFLVLNVLSDFILRFPGVLIRAAKIKLVPATLKKNEGPRKVYYAKLNAEVDEEDVQDLMRNMNGRIFKPFGKMHILKENKAKEEMQLGSRKGRLTPPFSFAIHISILVILAGFIANEKMGFEGKIVVDEGQKSNLLEIYRGKSEIGKPFEHYGKESIGFRHAPFSLGVSRIDFSPVIRSDGNEGSQFNRAFITIYSPGKAVQHRRLKTGLPLHFGRYRLFAGGSDDSGDETANLIVWNTESMSRLRFSKLIPGKNYDLGQNKSFRILDFGVIGDKKNAVLVSYGSKDFWVYADGANEDEESKNAAHLFNFERKFNRLRLHIGVTHHPGHPWIVGGFALLCFSLIFLLLFPQGQFRLIQNAKGFTFIGWSEGMIGYRVQFERALALLVSETKFYDENFNAEKIVVKNGFI